MVTDPMKHDPILVPTNRKIFIRIPYSDPPARRPRPRPARATALTYVIFIARGIPIASKNTHAAQSAVTSQRKAKSSEDRSDHPPESRVPSARPRTRGSLSYL
jgi:hypothetical protein